MFGRFIDGAVTFAGWAGALAAKIIATGKRKRMTRSFPA
jgi:hypothetical protein